MIAKQILYFGHKLILACDACCEKAWGINNRPRLQVSPTDEDDYAFQADGELEEAPADPGTVEGGDCKPRLPRERLNKWCCRECERSVRVKPGEDCELPDFTLRVYNIPSPDGNGKAV
jgi:hypothetical protein